MTTFADDLPNIWLNFAHWILTEQYISLSKWEVPLMFQDVILYYILNSCLIFPKCSRYLPSWGPRLNTSLNYNHSKALRATFWGYQLYSTGLRSQGTMCILKKKSLTGASKCEEGDGNNLLSSVSALCTWYQMENRRLGSFTRSSGFWLTVDMRSN